MMKYLLGFSLSVHCNGNVYINVCICCSIYSTHRHPHVDKESAKRKKKKTIFLFGNYIHEMNRTKHHKTKFSTADVRK